MKKIITAVVIALSLSSCAIAPPKVFHFDGQKDCNLAWQRAQLKMATMGQLTVVTDVLIQGSYMDWTNHPQTIAAVRQNQQDGTCTISMNTGYLPPVTDL